MAQSVRQNTLAWSCQHGYAPLSKLMPINEWINDLLIHVGYVTANDVERSPSSNVRIYIDSLCVPSCRLSVTAFRTIDVFFSDTRFKKTHTSGHCCRMSLKAYHYKKQTRHSLIHVYLSFVTQWSFYRVVHKNVPGIRLLLHLIVPALAWPYSYIETTIATVCIHLHRRKGGSIVWKQN